MDASLYQKAVEDRLDSYCRPLCSGIIVVYEAWSSTQEIVTVTGPMNISCRHATVLPLIVIVMLLHAMTSSLDYGWMPSIGAISWICFSRFSAHFQLTKGKSMAFLVIKEQISLLPLSGIEFPVTQGLFLSN